MSREANRALLTALEAEQARLREMVAGRDAGALANRPRNGKWSVIENVRHLIFAEQSHFFRFTPGGPAWSRFGLPPDGMRGQKRFEEMVATETSDVGGVLAAWHSIHAKLRPHLQGEDERLGTALERNLRHLRTHIRVIERLLRDR